MSNFELSHLADGDLVGIIRYTIKKWDTDQAIRYVGFLDAHFDAIGRGEARARVVFGHRADLHTTRCQRHVIFFQKRVDDRPLILAVLHEQMKLMERLQERLDEI